MPDKAPDRRGDALPVGFEVDARANRFLVSDRYPRGKARSRNNARFDSLGPAPVPVGERHLFEYL
nr:MAG: hypothetical protein DIU78_17405 [Pseudomonadota bacterium]